MKGPVALLILGLFVGFFIVAMGCCGSTGGVQTGVQGNQQTSGSPAVQQAEPPQSIENGQIGTPYEVNYLGSNYQVTLLETAFESSSYSEQRYLLANFEIKNIGDSSEYFTPDVYLLDSSSEKYDKTIAFGVPDKYSKTLEFIKKLTPGTKTTGWVTIEVPAGLTQGDLYFEYTNSFVSDTPRYIKYKITG